MRNLNLMKSSAMNVNITLKTMYRQNIIYLMRKLHKSSVRKSSSLLTNKSIIGRDFLNIQDFTPNELKSVLWTALDLKNRFKNWSTQDSMGLAGVLITLLLPKPCVKNQSNIVKATQLLGARNCTIVDENWECSPSVVNTGRYLSTLSSVIVASAVGSKKSLNDLATGATVPVINLGSPDSCPLIALGYALTVLNACNRLERLRVAWVGPSHSPILGSLLLLMPKLRVHFYFTTENCQIPSNLEEALKLSAHHRSEIHHVEKPEHAIYKADAIITTAHNLPGFQINKTLVDDAAVNWIFLHDLPRTPTEVTDYVFCHRKNSLVWEAAENHFWVTMAVILKTVCDYGPKIPAPMFSED
ncbi:hypothetical protein J437_LFUL003036 [Ladona fulva]|uniref:ornithine carbamoyltransferase n=1 Tax=Ladona fulva TaxID=123851 RepID=A0A8K0JX90_LADFU|nr:hypothetical protein J437_LFUL003036 [Ladona fulva]